MKIYLRTHREKCVFPATKTPAWAGLVDRWYQLDAPAYGFAQAYSNSKNELGPHPGLIIIASPRASNTTDRAFASGGAASPSRFVHTLPNIRSVSLLQVMGWHGPLLCVQDDPRTIRHALDQALAHFESDETLRSVWVVSFVDSVSETSFFVLTRDPSGPVKLERTDERLTLGDETDQQWLDWVYKGDSTSFNLTDHYLASNCATFISGA